VRDGKWKGTNLGYFFFLRLLVGLLDGLALHQTDRNHAIPFQIMGSNRVEVRIRERKDDGKASGHN